MTSAMVRHHADFSLGGAAFPSSQRRGGAKRRGGQTGEMFAELTTFNASRYRARAARPSAQNDVASLLLY